MPRELKISVIIPTYNGAHKVVNALESLARQTREPDEIIVVVDGSTDDTMTVLRQRQSPFRNLRIIGQENAGRAAVRNRGAQEASHDLLLFMDDDIIAPENWVLQHIRHHEQYAGSLVSGRLDEYTRGEQEFDIFERWLNSRWNKVLQQVEAGEMLLENPYITANNFSIRKQDFIELGMFDSRLTDAEDYDLAVRAKQQGKQMYLSHNCWAWHNDITGMNFRSYIRRLREYRKAQETLIRLKPELYGDPATNERYPVLPHGLKAIFFRLFVNRWLVRSLGRRIWKIFPPKIRCRLYSFIVTANGAYYPSVKI